MAASQAELKQVSSQLMEFATKTSVIELQMEMKKMMPRTETIDIKMELEKSMTYLEDSLLLKAQRDEVNH